MHIKGKDSLDEVKRTRVGNKSFKDVLIAELIKANTKNYKKEEKIFLDYFKKVAKDDEDIDFYKTWIGKDNFSERIWKNRIDLARTINNKFYKAVKENKGYNEFIKDTYQYARKENRYNAIRLLRTEGNRIHNEVVKNNLIKDKYKQYIYCAILDNRTTEDCKDLDGSIFYLSEYEVGVNAPPMHPNCRSYIIGNEEFN